MGQEIKGKENGPYLIVGTAVFIDADSNEQTTQGSTIALCRCGQSGDKPFCDGTHRKVGFQAPAASLKLRNE